MGSTSEEEREQAAIDTVARQLITAHAHPTAFLPDVQGLPTPHWRPVAARVEAILADLAPATDDYQAAVEYLRQQHSD